MQGEEFARIKASISTTSGAYIGTWEPVGQDISAKTTTIKLRGYIYYWGALTMKASGGYGFLIDGKTIASGSAYEYSQGYHFLGETTITVPHNSDGTFPGRSVTLSVSGYTHFKGTATGTIKGVSDINISENFNRSVVYLKQNGSWVKVTSYLKVNGSYGKTRENYKEGGTWK